MFQLSKDEFKILRSQIVTSSWGGRRYPPYAFTEQGREKKEYKTKNTKNKLESTKYYNGFTK